MTVRENPLRAAPETVQVCPRKSFRARKNEAYIYQGDPISLRHLVYRAKQKRMEQHGETKSTRVE